MIKEKENGMGVWIYGDIDAVGREANAAEEGEGRAVGAVESEEVIEVWNIDVLVIEENAVLVGGFVVGHGFRWILEFGVYGSLSSTAEEGETVSPCMIAEYNISTLIRKEKWIKKIYQILALSFYLYFTRPSTRAPHGSYRLKHTHISKILYNRSQIYFKRTTTTNSIL